MEIIIKNQKSIRSICKSNKIEPKNVFLITLFGTNLTTCSYSEFIKDEVFVNEYVLSTKMANNIVKKTTKK